MASNGKDSVIRRSLRGRTGIDVNAKTDSGCFVDDELEKQTQSDKSSGKKIDEKFIKRVEKANDNVPNRSATSDRIPEPHDVVVGRQEMSRENASSGRSYIHDDSQNSEDWTRSAENTERRDDFYCLYYSDSPNGSLTKSKDNDYDATKSSDVETIGTRAEELLERIKTQAALRSQKSPEDTTVDTQFNFEQKAPPVASKPKRSPKGSRDPILDELDQLGASVGRDFAVAGDDESLFSSAVKELHVAQTPEECLDKFGAIQTALLVNVPDTLERNKSKNKSESSRRKSFPGVEKSGNVSMETSKGGDKNRALKGKTTIKKAESPKSFKPKIEVKKVSRNEVESLNSMKGDSHHRRSHMNSDTTKTTPTKSDSRPNRTDSAKRIPQRNDPKGNLKKDPKATISKGVKEPKKDLSLGSKDVTNSTSKNAVTKRKERIELRSRRKLNGDLSSIPENAVMGERSSKNSPVPIAGGEEDLSSDEERGDDINDVTMDEDDLHQVSSTPETVKVAEDQHVSTTRSSMQFTASQETKLASSVTQVLEKRTFSSKSTVDNPKSLNSDARKDSTERQTYSEKSMSLKERFLSQGINRTSSRGRESPLSDGWTSESTAGYSSECSANDADDERDKQAALERSDDFQSFGDPEEIGGQIDGQYGDLDNYVYEDERSQEISPDGYNDSASMTYHSQAPESQQLQLDNRNYALQSDEFPSEQDDDTEVHQSEYNQDVNDFPYRRNSEMENSFDTNVNTSVERRIAPRYNEGVQSDELVDSHSHAKASRKHRNVQKEQGPDPSGFMTVQDIRRLIYQGANPSIPRSGSFCGSPSFPRGEMSQEQDVFQRKSWSGYGIQQQQEPGVDPLVRTFPQEANKMSPYVRTVSQKPSPQLDSYSDTRLNAVQEHQGRPLVRSQSFNERPSQRRANSLDNYHLNAVNEEQERIGERSRSSRRAPLQRRATSLDNDHSGHANNQEEELILKRSQPSDRAPLQRRANSLENDPSGYYHLNASGQEVERVLKRSQSLNRAPLQRRANSLEDDPSEYYHLNTNNQEEERTLKRSQPLNRAPLQRRANSLEDEPSEYYHLNTNNQEEERILKRSQPLNRAPLQRRANSLEDDHSNNRWGVSPPVPRSAKSKQLVRSSSDSSDYSQHEYTQRSGRHRVNSNPRIIRDSPHPQYISAQELAEMVSSQSTPMNYGGDPSLVQGTVLSNQRGNASSFPRHLSSSESLRIQAIRRASQMSSESDNYPSDEEPLDAVQTPPPVAATRAESLKQKTLSERFSEVPQRVNFEELAEQLDLQSDEEDDNENASLDGGAESEFGADLEFDNGDYFDDKNMIVGEVMRLKKVLGSTAQSDPELEHLVTATTDIKLLPSKDLDRPVDRPPPYCDKRTQPPQTTYDKRTMYECDSDTQSDTLTDEKNFRVTFNRDNDFQRDRESSSLLEPPVAPEKAISAEELLKILLTSSRCKMEEDQSLPKSESKGQHLAVQSLYFPAPQTKAASTGNIHSEKTFPGHVSQLYGNTDVNGARSSLSHRRYQPEAPTAHKSQECLRKSRSNETSGVLKAKMVSSTENTKSRSSDPSRRVFEEEVDCMKTRGSSDLSSEDMSTSGSSLEDEGVRNGRATSVSYIGCEETKELETLPRVRLSSQKKRRKAKVGYLSDQDIPETISNGSNTNIAVKKSNEKLNGDLVCYKQLKEIQRARHAKMLQDEQVAEIESLESKKKEMKSFNFDLRTNEGSPEAQEDQTVELPHDDLPSPNSVNVFIDYKKKVMKVSTSTPNVQHGTLITQIPASVSPISGSPERRREDSASMGEEDIPPRYESSNSSSDRSSSAYSSSDEDKFFGSSDTVVFVDKSKDNCVKPNVDNTRESSGSPDDQGCSPEEAARVERYSARVDSILQEVRSSLDLDSIGSDLLDQAMERVKDKLSPRHQNQATGGLTMEAYVALHQADELQAIINEIKSELWVLQEENTLLKRQVVSLQHNGSRSSSESTEDSLTESAERIDSIRRQIAAVVANRHQGTSEVAAIPEVTDLITVDVHLRGFGNTVCLRNSKKTDVKLGKVTVRGGSDWTGIYDAAKNTFLDHIKRIDTSSCLGLGPTSMYGAQIGATMLTPETLRKKNPRVEIARNLNSCVIQLKDGMTDNFDSLVYDTLIPKPVIESFVHQILENRFIVLCGSVGLGKTFLATRLAEHLAQRFGSKTQSAVLTLTVGQTTRKELKKTLVKLMKSDISNPSDGVPVVVILDRLDCLASLADIFEPKQLEGNRNSPFIIGVRNKSKKGPFSSKELAVYKYFRWIQMSIHDHYALGLLERFLRRKFSWTENVENEEDLLDLFLWLTHVWQRINQILQAYVDIEVTIGPSLFYTCPMDMHAAEGWFANVWNYTIIPYLHQNLRNSTKIYERNVPWEDPTKWVIMRWPWNRDRSKVITALKKLRQVDIVLNRNNMESTKGNDKRLRNKPKKLLSAIMVKNPSPSKAGSLESWSTADWDAASLASEADSIDSSTL